MALTRRKLSVLLFLCFFIHLVQSQGFFFPSDNNDEDEEVKISAQVQDDSSNGQSGRNSQNSFDSSLGKQMKNAIPMLIRISLRKYNSKKVN